MSVSKDIKRDVWKSLFRLIIPKKRTFILVVFIWLLSTMTGLIEPLIYREAINDVAGLFVKQAKDNTRKELGVDVEDENPITDFFEHKVSPNDNVDQAPQTSTQQTKTKDKHKKKEPHRPDHVAGRTPEQALDTLLWAVLLLFLLNVIGYVFWLIADNMNVRLSCMSEKNFIKDTFKHVLQLPLSFFGKRSRAALSKQINQSDEVTAIIYGLSQEILPETISLIGILCIMFWQNVTLTLIALSVIPVYLFIAWRSANRLETGLSEYYEKWEEVSAKIQDALSGIKTVKLSGAELREVEQMQKVADEAYENYIKRSKLANKYVFFENLLTRLAMALVLGYGGYLTLKHKLTPGDVVMFVAYLDRLYDPIDSLANLWVSLQQNIASIARAFNLLKSGEEEKKRKELILEHGKIEFKNVQFGYSPKQNVLKNLSFTVEPGKITALVGPSGAGKTTTVDLLMKLYDYSSGEIYIDKQALSKCDAASVRSQIGMVAADGAIFRGTLAENIRYRRQDASDEDTKAAAIAAGMENTLQRLPEGLNTLVGESGMGLSVGERQRIQIARVLLAQPRILILDEATANLDYATEAEVKKTIDEIRKENTVIIIAHRYSMVRDADHVIVLEAGKLLEEGSPSELIKKDGWFAKFANSAVEENEEIIEDDENTAEESDETEEE